MGYSIRIGNRVDADADGKECGFEFMIEDAESPDAPKFDGDETTGQTNRRLPTYGAWTEFAADVGLTAFFFDKEKGLMRDHPDVQLLTPEHLVTVRASIGLWGARHRKPPGWGHGQDGHKARLLWLEWWIDWALRTCAVPAFGNS